MHYLKKLLDSLSQNKKQIEEISEYVLYKNINIGEREDHHLLFMGLIKIEILM